MKTNHPLTDAKHPLLRAFAQTQRVDNSSLAPKPAFQTRRRKDYALGQLVLRLMLGASFIFHGVNRLAGGVSAFGQMMVKKFSGSLLPDWGVSAFATGLPFVELILGVLLLLGFKTRWALPGAGLVLVSLTAGSGLIGDWNAIGLQLLHALVVYQAMLGLECNAFSLDGLLARKPATGRQ